MPKHGSDPGALGPSLIPQWGTLCIFVIVYPLSLWSVGFSVSLSLNIAYMMVILDVIQGLSSPQREL